MTPGAHNSGHYAFHKPMRLIPETVRWPTDPVTLKTQRLILRPPLMTDASTLALILQQPQVLEGLDKPNAPSTDTIRDWIGASQVPELARRLAFVIESRRRHKIFGALYLDDINPFTRTCQMTIWLAKRSSGRGYASEATRELLAWGFASLNVEEVQAYCRPANERAKNLVRGLGMHDAGVRELNKKSDPKQLAVWRLFFKRRSNG